MLKRAFKVAYIRRKNKQFGKLNKSGAREFSTAETQEKIDFFLKLYNLKLAEYQQKIIKGDFIL